MLVLGLALLLLLEASVARGEKAGRGVTPPVPVVDESSLGVVAVIFGVVRPTDSEGTVLLV